MTTITFEDFFKQRYDAVEAGVRGSGARPDVAAEATQEAFVRAYPHWWRLSRYHNPAAWVQRVASNGRRELERSDKRTQVIVASTEVENPGTPAVDPRVDSAVSSLPPNSNQPSAPITTKASAPAKQRTNSASPPAPSAST